MANRWGNNGNSNRLIFWGSKITADGDFSHEIKRRLLLGRKAMTNLDSILKSRDITLLPKTYLVKALVFPEVICGCESWPVKKAEYWRIDAFELWCWRRLLRIPWTAKRSNQSILKEISPEYSLEGLMLKLKLQYFGHLMGRIDSLERPWCWERLKAGGEGDITDLMDMSLSKPQELLMQQQPEAWFTAVHELQWDGHDWAIEQNWWQQYQSMGSKTPLLQFIQGGEIGDSWGKEGVVSYRKLPDLSNRKSLELPCSVSSQEVSLQGSATRNYNDKCRSWYVLYTYVPVTGLRSQYLSRRLLLKAHISTFTFNCKKRERERERERQHVLCPRQTLNRPCF